MASNKRRKIEGSLETRSISAFAARRQIRTLVQDAESSLTPSNVKGQSQHNVDEDALFDGTLIEASSTESLILRRGLDGPRKTRNETRMDQGDEMSDSPGEGEEEIKIVTEKSREAIQSNTSRPSFGLTNWKHSNTNVSRRKNNSLIIKLSAGQRLVILGEYGLSVVKGQITILGATISASGTVYSVYALASHSLPVIRFLASEDSQVEICIHQQRSGIRNLRHMSPLFSRLSSDGFGSRNSDSGISPLVDIPNSSFKILFSSDDAPRGVAANPIVSPPEWNEVIAVSASGKFKHGKPSITIICGPKSSGKSTFARLLTNRLLSVEDSVSNKNVSGSQKAKSGGVAFLDIDPGQPEFSTPGHISLLYLTHLNLGPPYSHPISSSSHEVIQSHSIAAISPAADPILYMKCVHELLDHYRNILSPDVNCPLIINTPGWVLGTGLEILLDLIKVAHPTEVVYMSQDGPANVVKALRDASKSIPVLTLPSQLTEYTARTAAHLRSMQVISYFHTVSTGKNQPAWNMVPLTALPPWEVTYADQTPGILGIMCVGEQPPPHMLVDTINGTLLSIVVLDDIAAIGLTQERTEEGTGTPMIINTPEGIPYFNPEFATSLDPYYSHAIGLALVRGIDIKRKRLQLLTPISMDDVKKIKEEGKVIILLSGKFDTPGWAYTEDLHKKSALNRHSMKDQKIEDSEEGSGNGQDSEDNIGGSTGEISEEGFNQAPWVEELRGDQGRGVGARVWRVRRDLGKTGDGGG